MTRSDEPEDHAVKLRSKIADPHGYDDIAIDQYVATGFYIAQRHAGVPLAQACQMTCEHFGHDAPRGQCQRCGLGVELGDRDKKRERERVAERDAFLASRRR